MSRSAITSATRLRVLFAAVALPLSLVSELVLVAESCFVKVAVKKHVDDGDEEEFAVNRKAFTCEKREREKNVNILFF